LNFNLLKQIIGILFSASSYYIIFKLANFNLKLLFDRYSRIAVYIAAFAIIEEALHLNGIHIRSEFPGSLGFYRVSGLSGEPYNLAMVLTPALLFCLIGIFSRNKEFSLLDMNFTIPLSIILFAFFLTFSTTGYIGLFIGLLLVVAHGGLLNIQKTRFIFFPLLLAIGYFTFNYIIKEDKIFERKFSEGIWLFNDEQVSSVKDYDRLNTSTFVLLSNYQIATESFNEHPYFGIGFGNYEMAYHEKFNQIFGQDFENKFGRSNFNDANSMFLRLLAESGFWGIAIFLTFLAVFLIKTIKSSSLNQFYLIAINHAVFVLFIIRLLRCGNYISDGAFFFLLLYYYTYKFKKELAPA
jgi:hypothetical protein